MLGKSVSPGTPQLHCQNIALRRSSRVFSSGRVSISRRDAQHLGPVSASVLAGYNLISCPPAARLQGPVELLLSEFCPLPEAGRRVPGGYGLIPQI